MGVEAVTDSAHLIVGKQSITLPWPPKDCRPNGSHGHWAKVASAKKGYKMACAWHAVEQKAEKMSGAVSVSITFHPPSNRRADLDNMLAAAKSGLDGVASVIGVDDSKWTLTLVRGEPRPKHGAIVLELEAI